jgi:MFS family permease
VRGNITISLIIAVLAFVVLWLYGSHMVGLIFGVILLDCGVQAGHVSNQTRIYGLLPEARSRLNMVYMICYFTAGAIGSYTGTLSWQHFGWNGVCALGGLMILLGAAVHTFTSLSRTTVHEDPNSRKREEPRAPLTAVLFLDCLDSVAASIVDDRRGAWRERLSFQSGPLTLGDLRPLVRGPEKAGGGGSIPSLATTPTSIVFLRLANPGDSAAGLSIPSLPYLAELYSTTEKLS